MYKLNIILLGLVFLSLNFPTLELRLNSSGIVSEDLFWLEKITVIH